MAMKTPLPGDWDWRVSGEGDVRWNSSVVSAHGMWKGHRCGEEVWGQWRWEDN